MTLLVRALAPLLVLFVAACGDDSPPTCNLEGGEPPAATAWPKFRGDPANSGRSAADLTEFSGPAVAAWTVRTGGPVLSSPTIGPEGEIYIGSSDGKVYRIDADGLETWQVATASVVNTGPALDAAGRLFVTSNDGNLYTLDSSTGEELRSPVLIFGVLAPPALGSGPNSGVAYIGSLSGGLFALCANNVLRWTAQIVPVANIPAVGSDGTVYIAGAIGARTVLAVDPVTGREKWIFTATATINAAPVVGSTGEVFVVDGAGRVFAIDPVTGTSPGLLFDAAAAVTASPALAADGTLYVADQAGRLTAFDTAAGIIRWTFHIPSGAPIFSSPVVTADGTLVFGADDGVVYAVQDTPEEGIARWAFTTGGSVRSSPAVATDGSGTIYVGSSDFNVYALRPE